MTPYFLDLLLFYKTKYWKYALRQRPVEFFSTKVIAVLLILLLLVQAGLAVYLPGTALFPLRHLSFGQLFGSGLVINLARLFYFPAGCQRDIKRGVYFLYPVSGYTLNNMRIVEGLFSIFFLVSCNLLVLPAFSWSLVYGLAFPVLVVFLYLLSLFIYDVVMLIFGKLWLLALILVLFYPLLPLFRAGYHGLNHFMQTDLPARPGRVVTATLLLSGIIYFLDTRILIFTSIKRIPHE